MPLFETLAKKLKKTFLFAPWYPKNHLWLLYRFPIFLKFQNGKIAKCQTSTKSLPWLLHRSSVLRWWRNDPSESREGHSCLATPEAFGRSMFGRQGVPSTFWGMLRTRKLLRYTLPSWTIFRFKQNITLLCIRIVVYVERMLLAIYANKCICTFGYTYIYTQK